MWAKSTLILRGIPPQKLVSPNPWDRALDTALYSHPERTVDFCSCKLDMLAIHGAQIASEALPKGRG